MALTFGFYNSINGDRTYDAIQVGQIFDGIITDGIYATYLKAMVVKASDNASEVIVQPGRAWFNHTWTYIDADYPVEAPAPEVILDRVDALVLDINAEYSNRENTIIWVTGTPASVNPERPSLTNTTTHHQYPIAYVYRKAGTTMIYAADITNMVGTSSTPFVTGVLTGINIDDLLSQWDDEFHTWENATKVSFEGWMVNQQSVYTTWFNAIKDQMEGDLDEFEAWFETIQGIIDEEAATHLQAEIDELKDMLPAGSHIDISTTEPTLYSRNVTVSDQGGHSKTVQFNASGSATVESFPYIGSIEVTSTDGERIATSNISIPYFGRYNTTLAFWAARVNLKGGAELGGYTVTVKDHLDVTVTSIVLNAEGNGVFTATYPDTYKFVYIYGGQTMETTLQVTQETTYEVEIHGGFNYQAWLTAGRVSKTFTSLDNILADEKTLRQLMLVHDSVDYLANANINDDVEKIFNTDLAAKWINNSDYALDKFYAVADIKTVMDTADKYGYGEWVNNNGTWGPKGIVPVMTSNTAPYGEVSANGSYGGQPYLVFDGDDSTEWLSSSGVGYKTIQYKSTNPVCVKKIHIHINSLTLARFQSIELRGSNDGSVWNTIISIPNADIKEYMDVKIESNTSYYLYHQLYFYNNNQYNCTIKTLQFYGRSLSVSVPTMTSNTAPFGEAFIDIAEASIYNGQAYNAFDKNESSLVNWNDNSHANAGYSFTTPMVLKKMRMLNTFTGGHTYTVKVQGSNGSSWIDLDSFTITGNNSSIDTVRDIANDIPYQKYRIYSPTNKPSGNSFNFVEINFYGKDYSEKEFEVGTTKKWLYDHGVELETITLVHGSAGTDPVKGGSSIVIQSTSASSSFSAVRWSIDFTNYNLARAKVGDSVKTTDSGCTMDIQNSGGTELAYNYITVNYVPNNCYLGVTSINQSAILDIASTSAKSAKMELVEVWLE